ncbi:MAG: 30S ribosome-binding factor RbfA [Acidobacteria bacterium]|jgi:ribosome-binding factor A|nr:30S ribosome-binding factor RbfA [Acidobacteriota bacterium]
MSYRLEKFASTLQQALGEILSRESLNPEFRRTSILRVLPAADLKRVTVCVSCPSDRAAAVLEQLQRSRGFIKKQLARKMILRYMPELDFTLDTSALLEDRLDRLRPREDAPPRDNNDHEAADR